MSFQSSDFEFRNRFWFIAVIYAITFPLYRIDQLNVTIAMGLGILRHAHPGTVVTVESPEFDHMARIIFGFGTLLLTLAALIRTWATSYLKSGVVHDAARHSELLVADGPYRHVRNPLYLGNILQALGIGLLASRLGFVFLTIANTTLMLRLILHEEAGLVQSQGESYRRYLAAVPRLWPSIRARVPGSGALPNWRDGFVGELFFWIFAAGMAVFTVSLDARYFVVALAVGFGLYFLQNFLRRGRIA